MHGSQPASYLAYRACLASPVGQLHASKQGPGRGHVHNNLAEGVRSAEHYLHSAAAASRLLARHPARAASSATQAARTRAAHARLPLAPLLPAVSPLQPWLLPRLLLRRLPLLPAMLFLLLPLLPPLQLPLLLPPSRAAAVAEGQLLARVDIPGGKQRHVRQHLPGPPDQHQ
jgi:hypothetical protein